VNSVFFRRMLIAVASAVTLGGCVHTPTVASYKGGPVAAINAVSMSCTEPYALVRGCSIWSGATQRVQLSGVVAKVAGTADGKIVLAQTDTSLLPKQIETEQVADAVQERAKAAGAKLLKIEALAVGGNVPGYIMHFDKDVYSELYKAALPN
jgi:hypothetical protein